MIIFLEGEFLDECKIKKIPLKSKKSISASYSNENTWYGYRPIAVDGSNLNLPKQLIGNGYKLPRPDAHYPQGKLSCLYNLKMELPWNFKFSSDKNERALAESHFSHLRKTDVVVYDRGYFSYGFIKKHFDLNLNFVMRLSSQFVFKEINDFIKSDKTDEVISIYPSTKRKRKILI